MKTEERKKEADKMGREWDKTAGITWAGWLLERAVDSRLETAELRALVGELPRGIRDAVNMLKVLAPFAPQHAKLTELIIIRLDELLARAEEATK